MSLKKKGTTEKINVVIKEEDVEEFRKLVKSQENKPFKIVEKKDTKDSK